MSEGEQRPIERADFERVQALLHAYEAALREPEVELWEHLAFFHREKLTSDARVAELDLAGDAGFARERDHVLRVVQARCLGQDTVQVFEEPIERSCATPACRNTTLAVFCPSCELERGT